MRPVDSARLLLLSALWGGSFIVIRIAAPVLGPILLVGLRVLVAGLALLAYAAATSARLELRRYWRQYLAIGALNSAIPFLLISTAELHLPASLAAILNATSPLFGALIAAGWIRDPLTPRKLAGILLGIAGVGVLAGWSPLALSATVAASIALSLLGAAFYGLASVYTKARVAAAPALGMATGSQLGAALLLAPLLPFSLPPAWPPVQVVLGVFALGLLCTALAYVLYFRLIADIGPVRALTVTLLIPLFGVVWAALLLGEPLSAGALCGCALILAGMALAHGLRAPRCARAAQ